MTMTRENLRGKLDSLLGRQHQLQEIEAEPLRLDCEIATLRHRIADVAEADEARLLMATQAKAEAKALVPDVVKATLALEATLRTYEEARRKANAYGAYSAEVPQALSHAVGFALRYWRNTSPELVGMAPRPSRREEAIRETQGEILRLSNLLQKAKHREGFDTRTGRMPNDTSQVQEQYEHALRLANTRLSELREEAG